MKKITTYLLCVITAFILNANFLNAQITTVYENTSGIGLFGMAFKGNDLYISSTKQSKIFKIDVTAIAPLTATNVADNLIFPSGLAFDGDDLYFGDAIYLSKINTVAPAAPVSFNLKDKTPYGIAINGGNLYFANFAGTVSRISTSNIGGNTANTVTNLDSGLYFPSAPNDVAVNGNYLYASLGDRIVKYDITLDSPSQIPVVSGINVKGLAFDGNILYASSSESGKIYKIDVTSAVPVAKEVLSQANFYPFRLAVKGTDLYIGESDRISKISLSEASLATEDHTFDNKNINISPNPASDFIQISITSNVKNYTIYDSTGKIVLKNSLPADKKIDIRGLVSGVYILVLDNAGKERFIKQ